MRRRERIELKTEDQIRRMRRAGLVVADVHDALREAVRPGTTTQQLDAVAAAVLERHAARSNFLGYHGFPAHICVSVNEEIVHGIPGSREIAEGDVVSFDCGAVVDGWHGDAAFSVVVGQADESRHGLVEGTRRSMWAGIAALARPRVHLNAVGAAIEDEIEAHARRTGQHLGIVEEYVGHGIGTAMHQPPDVVNFRTRERGPRVKPGTCLCIEPMIAEGSPDNDVLADGWTVVTKDRSRAAHWEHAVAVHERGIWVLTAHDGGVAGLAEFGVSPVPLDR